MKTIKLLGFALFTVLLCVSFSACGGDGDGDGGGGTTPPAGKRLVKVTEKGEKSTYVNEYTYDSQGRVVRIESTKNGEKRSNDTYAYSDKKIVERHYSYSSNSTSETEYTLENGFIVSEKHNSESNNVNYTYANGHLATKTNSSYTYKYTWSGGNLMTIEREGKIKTLEYTSYIAPQLPFVTWDMDEVLASYLGLTTTNLPLRYNDGDEVINFDWTMSKGLPVKLIISETDSKDSYTDVITFEWQ